MRYLVHRIALLSSVCLSLLTPQAHANNTAVENALKDRPDLSIFYQGLVNTGVMSELNENTTYTIFAPTNDAFSNLPPDKYPCFYAVECREKAAEILRHHIVPGEKHLSEIGKNSGGIMSMYTIDDHHITANEPYKNDYAVNGRNVLSQQQLTGAILYRVDGVITNVTSQHEMAQFAAAPQPAVTVIHTDNNLPPRIPEGVIVTVPAENNEDSYSVSPAR